MPAAAVTSAKRIAPASAAAPTSAAARPWRRPAGRSSRRAPKRRATSRPKVGAPSLHSLPLPASIRPVLVQEIGEVAFVDAEQPGGLAAHPLASAMRRLERQLLGLGLARPQVEGEAASPAGPSSSGPSSQKGRLSSDNAPPLLRAAAPVRPRCATRARCPASRSAACGRAPPFRGRPTFLPSWARQLGHEGLGQHPDVARPGCAAAAGRGSAR